MRSAGGYRNRSLIKTIDWWLVGCWFVLVCIGLVNIYAAIHSPEEAKSLFDWGTFSGKQCVWIATSMVIAAIILFVIPPTAYEGLSLFIYIGVGLLLISVAAIIYTGFDGVTLKILFILGFFWLTSPVSGHLLGRLVSETDEHFQAEAEIWKR
jgi:cell division protein FtsW (lipid II flippase)